MAQEAEPGSARIAFYFNSLYQYIAAMFLLDKKHHPMGGIIYKALKPMGLAFHLENIKETLSHQLGKTTLGEIIRNFRNQFLIHGKCQTADLIKIYSLVNMEDLSIKLKFDELMETLYFHIKELAINLCSDAKIELQDVGIYKAV